MQTGRGSDARRKRRDVGFAGGKTPDAVHTLHKRARSQADLAVADEVDTRIGSGRLTG